jgi:hypothetical protein
MLEVVHKEKYLAEAEKAEERLEMVIKELDRLQQQTPEAVDVEDLLDPLMLEDQVDLELLS